MNFAEMDGEALSTTTALLKVEGSAPKTMALGWSQQRQQGGEKRSEALRYPQLASVEQLNFGPGDDGTTEEPSTATDAAGHSAAASGSSDTTSVPISRVEEEDDSDPDLFSLTSTASDSQDDESAAVTDDETDLADDTAVSQTVSILVAVAIELDTIVTVVPQDDYGAEVEGDTLESPSTGSAALTDDTSRTTSAAVTAKTITATVDRVDGGVEEDTQEKGAVLITIVGRNQSAAHELERLPKNSEHYTGIAGPSSVSLAANRQPDAAAALTGTPVQAETAPSGDDCDKSADHELILCYLIKKLNLNTGIAGPSSTVNRQPAAAVAETRHQKELSQLVWVSPQHAKDLTLSSSESSEDEVQTNGHGSSAAPATAAADSEGSDDFETEADQMTEGETSPPPQKIKRGQQSRNHPGKSISKRPNRQGLRASVPSAELRSTDTGGDVGIERRRERSRGRADVRGRVKSARTVNSSYQDKKRGKRLSKHPDKSIRKNSDRQGIGEVEPTATCSGALGTGGKRKVVEGASANSTDVCKKKKLKDSGSSFHCDGGGRGTTAVDVGGRGLAGHLGGEGGELVLPAAPGVDMLVSAGPGDGTLFPTAPGDGTLVSAGSRDGTLVSAGPGNEARKKPTNGPPRVLQPVDGGKRVLLSKPPKELRDATSVQQTTVPSPIPSVHTVSTQTAGDGHYGSTVEPPDTTLNAGQPPASVAVKKSQRSGSTITSSDGYLTEEAGDSGSAGGHKKRKRDEEDPEGERPVKRGKGDEDATSKIAHEDRTEPAAGSM